MGRDLHKRSVRVGSLCTGAGTDNIILEGVNETLANSDDGIKAGEGAVEVSVCLMFLKMPGGWVFSIQLLFHCSRFSHSPVLPPIIFP